MKTGGSRFDAKDFKAQSGASKTSYDVSVAAFVKPWLDVYISYARPILLGTSKNDKLFVSNKGKAFDVNTLSALIWRISHLHLEGHPEIPGFRTHAFRHIVATAWLKEFPGQFHIVALILHDTLETVLENYAHISPDEGISKYGEWLDVRLRNL